MLNAWASREHGFEYWPDAWLWGTLSLRIICLEYRYILTPGRYVRLGASIFASA